MDTDLAHPTLFAKYRGYSVVYASTTARTSCESYMKGGSNVQLQRWCIISKPTLQQADGFAWHMFLLKGLSLYLLIRSLVLQLLQSQCTEPRAQRPAPHHLTVPWAKCKHIPQSPLSFAPPSCLQDSSLHGEE